MLMAVATIDRKSHAEVAKMGRSVHNTMLSMGTMCCKACCSNNVHCMQCVGELVHWCWVAGLFL